MRGRPTAATQHCDKGLSDTIKANYPDSTTRTHAAIYYRSCVMSLLEAASDIPYLDGIFKITERENHNHGVREKGEITEQLGRMLEQDGYSQDDVLKVARIAAKAYHDGYTVKQIKAYIQNGRKSGEW